MIKAKQYDYESTQVSRMIEEGISEQNGIKLLTKEELQAKYRDQKHLEAYNQAKKSVNPKAA